ncbi:MAG: acetate kinase [Eubacteriales bacterium]|nr:acetate kinase [Clostridiales bacterium]MDY5836925.1 acetate kinase [Eubacteriales bacterium]
MIVLVINAGSSSLKYQLLNTQDGHVLAKGLCERIGIDGSRLKHEPAGKDKYLVETPMPTHQTAVQLVLDALVSPEHGVIKSMKEIDAVGHRILNCADYYTQSVLIDDDVKETIRKCFSFAPLHNPANLMGVEACQEIMPDIPMVAAFDTSFHQSMPPQAYMYGLPYRYYEDQHIRRYGAHGTSHHYVSQRAAEFLGKDQKGLRMITLHLGNGSSISAVKDGKCQDTSMGLTPLEGPLMGTRCGSIDPAIVVNIMDREKLNPQEMDHLMNKESGVLGISGVSSDFRDLEEAANAGNARAQLALDMFSYQCKKILGSYVFALGGVDVLVFTAGIGENDSKTRASICSGLEAFGIKIDPAKNDGLRGKEAIISADDSKVTVVVIPTNEELMIARDTEAIVKSL